MAAHPPDRLRTDADHRETRTKTQRPRRDMMSDKPAERRDRGEMVYSAVRQDSRKITANISTVIFF